MESSSAPPVCEWPKVAITKLIETAKNYPCLWITKHKYYKHRTNRASALHNISNTLKPLLPGGCSVDIIRKKWQIIRIIYRRELKKLRLSTKSGCGADVIYTPKLWYFKDLRFLDESVDEEDL